MERLKKKQSSNNRDWVNAWHNCTKTISRSHIETLTENTVNMIRSVIAEHGFKRVAYSWSGGKDSIVLYDVLKKSGIEMIGGVLALYEHEFPEFYDWLCENKPPEVQVIKTNAFTDDFLNKNPEYLFPMETKYKDAYLPPRWKVQNDFIKNYGVDCMILGRRLADGNNCGKRDNNFVTTSKKGCKFNPLADWTHEDILAYIQYNELELPPIYFYENGFKAGTQVWTEKRRINGHFFETFDLLMEIDERIIQQSIGKLKIVDEYIEYKKNGGTIK